MKAIVYALAGALMVSFTDKKTEAVDGIWTGVYRTDNQREKVLVKFESENQLELYNGDVVESNRREGKYELLGDTALKFTYQDSEGQSYVMTGSINKRRNYVDGTWEVVGKRKGSFYLKKEKLEEMYVTP